MATRMKIDELIVLIEDESGRIFLTGFLKKYFAARQINFSYDSVIGFNGKSDILRKLSQRLKAFSGIYSGQSLAVIVILDRDADDCKTLISQINNTCQKAGFATYPFTNQVAKHIAITRLAIWEMEAWYLGDWENFKRTFGLKNNPRRQPPDYVQRPASVIEALFNNDRKPFRKSEIAAKFSSQINWHGNTSVSFQKLIKVLDILK